MTLHQVEELLQHYNSSAIVLDGLDDAVIGVNIVVETDERHIVYDRDKCIECLKKQGMSAEEAEDFFSYNTLRAIPYMPENERPIVVYT